MKKIIVTALTLVCGLCINGFAKTHYVGGDISLLPEYENAGAKYLDHDGKPIADLLPWLHDRGMNAMRVRLFVNPDNYSGTDKDANACQSLEYVLPLCKRIKQDGFALVLDFHYSDTWADPAKQWTPKDWANLSDDELVDKIAEYTGQVLTQLKNEGIEPDFIQPGNEISFGMLWGTEGTPEAQLKKTLQGSSANWSRLGRLLNSAIAACREVCNKAKIIIHTERVGNDMTLVNFYNQMAALGVDYDIIGLSYYPYFHGDMSTLSTSLNELQRRFSDKDIMIVETGYAYKWAVPGSIHDFSGTWPYSDAGQAAFARDLVSTLEKYDNVTGLFWWWLEYNAYNTTLQGWYNAPLFDSSTGRACAALTEICSFANDGSGVKYVYDEWSEGIDYWYDLSGHHIAKPTQSGIYIKNGRAVIVK